MRQGRRRSSAALLRGPDDGVESAMAAAAAAASAAHSAAIEEKVQASAFAQLQKANEKNHARQSNVSGLVSQLGKEFSRIRGVAWRKFGYDVLFNILDDAVDMLAQISQFQDNEAIKLTWSVLDELLDHPEPLVRGKALECLLRASQISSHSLSLCSAEFSADLVTELFDATHGDKCPKNRSRAGMVLASLCGTQLAHGVANRIKGECRKLLVTEFCSSYEHSGSEKRFSPFCNIDHPQNESLERAIAILSHGHEAEHPGKQQQDEDRLLLLVCAELLDKDIWPGLAPAILVQLVSFVNAKSRFLKQGARRFSTSQDMEDAIGEFCAVFLPVLNDLFSCCSAEEVEQQCLVFMQSWTKLYLKMDDLEVATLAIRLRKKGLEAIPKIVENVALVFPNHASLIMDCEIEENRYQERLRQRIEMMRNILQIPGSVAALVPSAQEDSTVVQIKVDGSIQELSLFISDNAPGIDAVSHLKLYVPASRDATVHLAVLVPGLQEVPPGCVTVPPVMLPMGISADQVTFEVGKLASAFGAAGGRTEFANQLQLGFSAFPGEIASSHDLKGKQGIVREGESDAVFEVSQAAEDVWGHLRDDSLPAGFCDSPVWRGLALNPREKNFLEMSILSASKSWNPAMCASTEVSNKETHEKQPAVSAYHALPKAPSVGLTSTALVPHGVVHVWIFESTRRPIRRFTLEIQAIEPFCDKHEISNIAPWVIGARVKLIFEQQGSLYRADLVVRGLQLDGDGLCVWGSQNPAYLGKFPAPIPAGIRPNGSPVFAPPVNFPPLPLFYDNQLGKPVYGSSALLLKPPVGLSEDGVKIFDPKVGASDLDVEQQPIGYSNAGHPLFRPIRGELPNPSGYTSFGVPFYSALALVSHNLFPRHLRRRLLVQNAFCAIAKSSGELEKGGTLDLTERDRDYLRSLGISDGKMRDTLDYSDSARRRLLHTAEEHATSVGLLFDTSLIHFDKSDIAGTKRIKVRQSRPCQSRVKVYLRSTNDGLISVTPASLTLTPEADDFDVDVRFDPTCCKGPYGIQGHVQAMTLVGTMLASCKVRAFCGPIIKVSSSDLSETWRNQGARAELHFSIENLCDEQVSLTMQASSLEEGAHACFALEQSQLTLFARQVEQISVSFVPDGSKKVCDGRLEICTSTGERHRVPLVARCGVPIVSRHADDDEWKDGDVQRKPVVAPRRRRRSSIGIAGASDKEQGDLARRRRSSILASMNIQEKPTIELTASRMQSGEEGMLGGKADMRTMAQKRWGLIRRLVLASNAVLRLGPVEKKPAATAYTYSAANPTEAAAQDLAFCLEQANRAMRDLLTLRGIFPPLTGLASRIFPRLKTEVPRNAGQLSLITLAETRGFGLEGDAAALPGTVGLVVERDPQLVVDFGLVDPGTESTKAFIVENRSDNDSIVGLQCSAKSLFRLPAHVVVPKQSTHVVQVVVKGQSGYVGPIEASIELVSPDLQRKQIIVLTAFLGRALECPLRPRVHFGVANFGQTLRVRLPIVNHSPYRITFVLLPFNNKGFQSSIGSDVMHPSVIEPFATIMADFSFCSNSHRGCYRTPLAIRVLSPNRTTYIPLSSAGIVELFAVVMSAPSPREHTALLSAGFDESFDLNRKPEIDAWLAGHGRFPGLAGLCAKTSFGQLGQEELTPEERETAMKRYALYDEKADIDDENPFKNALVWAELSTDKECDHEAGTVPPYGIAPAESWAPITRQLLNTSSELLENVIITAPSGIKLSRSVIKRLEPGDSAVVLATLKDDETRDHLELDCLSASYYDREGSLQCFAATPLLLPAEIKYAILPRIGASACLDFPRCQIGESSLMYLTARSLCSVRTAWSIAFDMKQEEKFGHDPFALKGDLESSGILDPFECIVIPVQFRPQAESTYRADIILTIYPAPAEIQDQGESPAKKSSSEREPLLSYTIPLTGYAFRPGIETMIDEDEELLFGNVPLGQEGVRTIVISNDSKMNEDFVFFTQKPFSCTPSQLRVLSEESVEVKVRFQPTKQGNARGRLSLLYGTKSISCKLAGIGGEVQPVFSCKTSTIDFGVRRIGARAMTDLYVTNLGSLPMILKDLQLGPEAVLAGERECSLWRKSIQIEFKGVVSQPDVWLTGTKYEGSASWTLLREELERATRSCLSTQVIASDEVNRVVPLGKLLQIGSQEFANSGGSIDPLRSRATVSIGIDHSFELSAKKFAEYCFRNGTRAVVLSPSDPVVPMQTGANEYYTDDSIDERSSVGSYDDSVPQSGRDDSLDGGEKSIRYVPALCPGKSWHFRVIFAPFCPRVIQMPLRFECGVWQTDQVSQDIQIGELRVGQLAKSRLHLTLTGSGIRSLRLSANKVDFGAVPASQFLTTSSSLSHTVARDGGKALRAQEIHAGNKVTHVVHVTNYSSVAQTLTLVRSTCSAFSMGEHKICVGPGERKDLQLFFEPALAQTEYSGEILLGDQFRTSKIQLHGFGTCAQVEIAEDEMRFGAVKLGQLKVCQLHLTSLGAIGSHVRLSLVSEYFYLLDSQQEVFPTLQLGPREDCTVAIGCRTDKSTPPVTLDGLNFYGSLRMEYELVPGGIWRGKDIELQAEVGRIELQADHDAVDFGLCVLSFPSTKTVLLRNLGTVDCEWSALQPESENVRKWLTIDPMAGTISPGAEQRLSFTLFADECDTIEDLLLVQSDGGDISLPVTAVMTAPKLILPPELDLDFGVLLGGESKRHSVKVQNSGRTVLDYEISLFDDAVAEVQKQQCHGRSVYSRVCDVWRSRSTRYLCDRQDDLPLADRDFSLEQKDVACKSDDSQEAGAVIKVNDNAVSETKCFSVSPRVGQIMPGDTLTVSLEANARDEELHERSARSFIARWRLSCKQIAEQWSGDLSCLLGSLRCRIYVPPQHLESFPPSAGRLREAASEDGNNSLVPANDLLPGEGGVCYFGVCMTDQPFLMKSAFVIANDGNVELEFNTRCAPSASDSDFSLSIADGTIMPGDLVSVDVTLMATSDGFHQQDIEVHISPAFGSSTVKVQKIVLCASSGTPMLLCSSESIEFGMCQLGLEHQRGINLLSEGNCAATWTARIEQPSSYFDRIEEARFDDNGRQDDEDTDEDNADDDDNVDSPSVDQENKIIDINENDSKDGFLPGGNYFRLDSARGFVKSQSQQVLTVSFQPPNNENAPPAAVNAYKAVLVIDWAGQDPFRVPLVGHGARGQLSWTEAGENLKDPRSLDFGTQPSYIGSSMQWKRIELINIGALALSCKITSTLPNDVFIASFSEEQAREKELEMLIDRRYEAARAMPDVDMSMIELGRAKAHRDISAASQHTETVSTDSTKDLDIFDEGFEDITAAKQHTVCKCLALDTEVSHALLIGFLPSANAMYNGEIRITSLGTGKEETVAVRGQGGNVKLGFSSSDKAKLKLDTVGLGYNNIRKLKLRNTGSLGTDLIIQTFPPQIANDVSVVIIKDMEAQYSKRDGSSGAGRKTSKRDMAGHIIEQAHDEQRAKQQDEIAEKKPSSSLCIAKTSVHGRSAKRLSICVHPSAQGAFQGFIVVRPTHPSLVAAEMEGKQLSVAVSGIRRNEKKKKDPLAEAAAASAGKFGFLVPIRYRAINNRIRLSQMTPFGMGRIPLGRTCVDARKITNPTELEIEFEVRVSFPSSFDSQFGEQSHERFSDDESDSDSDVDDWVDEGGNSGDDDEKEKRHGRSGDKNETGDANQNAGEDSCEPDKSPAKHDSHENEAQAPKTSIPVWRVQPLKGKLKPGQEMDFVVEYESKDDNPECWHEMRLEFWNGATDSVDIVLDASGSVGSPSLGINMVGNSVDFGDCQIGTFVAVPLTLWNAGTGMLHVSPSIEIVEDEKPVTQETVQPQLQEREDSNPLYIGWPEDVCENSGTLSPAERKAPAAVDLALAVGSSREVKDYSKSLIGKIGHGWGHGEGISKPSILGYGVLAEEDKLELLLVFAPKTKGEFNAVFVLRTNCGVLERFTLCGQGHNFDLRVGEISQSISFGSVIMGETVQLPFQLRRYENSSNVPVKFSFDATPNSLWPPPLGIGGIVQVRGERSDNAAAKKSSKRGGKQLSKLSGAAVRHVNFSAHSGVVGTQGLELFVNISIPGAWCGKNGAPTQQGAKQIAKLLREQPRAPKFSHCTGYIFAPGKAAVPLDISYRLEPPRVLIKLSDTTQALNSKADVTITNLSDLDSQKGRTELPQALDSQVAAEITFGSILLANESQRSIVLHSNSPMPIPFEVSVHFLQKLQGALTDEEDVAMFFRLSRKSGIVDSNNPIAVKLWCNFRKSFDSSKTPVFLRISLLHGVLRDAIVPVHVRTIEHVFSSHLLGPIRFAKPIFIDNVDERDLILENVSKEVVNALVTFSDPYCFFLKGHDPADDKGAKDRNVIEGVSVSIESGEKAVLPVVFRPEVQRNYEGIVSIRVKELVFTTSLSGTGCEPSISVRPANKIDFGFTGVYLASRKEFEVKSTCLLPLAMFIDGVPEGFTVTPSAFQLDSRASQKVIVDFKPLSEELYAGGLMLRGHQVKCDAKSKSDTSDPANAPALPMDVDEDEDRTVLLEHALELIGHGGRVELTVAPNIAFGLISTHMPHKHLVRVTNTGDVSMDLQIAPAPGRDTIGVLKCIPSVLSLLPTQAATIEITLTLAVEGDQRFPITFIPLGCTHRLQRWKTEVRATGDKIRLSEELTRILNEEELPLLKLQSDDAEDLHLDKVLQPIVNLKPVSTDSLLGVIEPVLAANLAIPDVLTRPPPLAIEPENPAFTRWHSNRVPLLMTARMPSYTFKSRLWERISSTSSKSASHKRNRVKKN